MIRNSNRNSRKALTIAALGLTLALAGTRATADTTWIGPTSGAQDWSDPANWDSTVPSSADTADIGDITADRTITTPNTSWTVTALNMTQSAGATSVDTLKLGADLYVSGIFAINFTNNPANSVSSMVLDLNGHKIGGYFPILGWNNMTIKNSGPSGSGGVETIYGIGMDNAVISSNVTVYALGVYYGGGYGFGTWMPGSKIVMRGAVQGYFPDYTNGGYYDMEIGEAGSPTQGAYAPYGTYAAYPFKVQHNLTIFEPTGAPSNPLILDGNTLLVGGNFVDHGLAADPSYTGTIGTPHSSAIVFNGNPVTANTVDIARHITDNSVDFRVGISTSDKGSIVLGQDLTMAGDMHVVDGSKLDVANHTLTVGNFLQDPTAGETAMTLGLTVGPQTGVVNVLGDLTLNDFTLDVSQLGEWAGLHTLVLFTYTGTLTGTPNITIGDINTSTNKFLYDSLVYGGGVVELTNAQIPEPASLGLLAVAGAFILPRRRRA